MIELYKNIKLKRMQLGLSQEELAKKTGYTDRTSISKIESGKVDLTQSKILEFARALQTTPGELMGWEQDYEPETLAAHKEGGEWTEEELESIEMFKELLRQKKNKK